MGESKNTGFHFYLLEKLEERSFQLTQTVLAFMKDGSYFPKYVHDAEQVECGCCQSTHFH